MVGHAAEKFECVTVNISATISRLSNHLCLPQHSHKAHDAIPEIFTELRKALEFQTLRHYNVLCMFSKGNGLAQYGD